MKSNGKTNRSSQRQNWTWPSYITSGVSGWAAQISASVALDLSPFFSYSVFKLFLNKLEFITTRLFFCLRRHCDMTAKAA